MNGQSSPGRNRTVPRNAHEIVEASSALPRVPVPAAVTLVDGFDAAATEHLGMARSLTKRLLDQTFDVSFDRALEAKAMARAVNGAKNTREAPTAFHEKRSPVFRGA